MRLGLEGQRETGLEEQTAHNQQQEHGAKAEQRKCLLAE